MCPEKKAAPCRDNILLEVLDPATQQPVSDGEAGEMVLTTLLKQRAR